MKWSVLSNPANRSQQPPEWARMAAIDGQERLYIPAAAMEIDDPSARIILDKDPDVGVVREGHYYLHTEWLKKAFPKDVAAIRRIEKVVHRHFEDLLRNASEQ